MLVRPLAALIMAASLAAITLPARADERSVLNACQALIDRAAPSAPNAAAAIADPAASGRPADQELQRCRQIVREWTLRDSRMSVDEHGRPLR